jgi:hypothetical protein
MSLKGIYPMIEIIDALTPLLLVILGSLGSIWGGLLHFKISDNSRRNSLLCSKLERAYELCQRVYDGHKREIGNARNFLPLEPSKYIEKRCHPGVEMSELKMLVRAYFRDLEKHLDTLDSGHNPLKNSFAKLDVAVAKRQLYVMEKPSLNLAFPASRDWDGHLKLLSKGSFNLKKELEAKMEKLV